MLNNPEIPTNYKKLAGIFNTTNIHIKHPNATLDYNKYYTDSTYSLFTYFHTNNMYEKSGIYQVTTDTRINPISDIFNATTLIKPLVNKDFITYEEISNMYKNSVYPKQEKILEDINTDTGVSLSNFQEYIDEKFFIKQKKI